MVYTGLGFVRRDEGENMNIWQLFRRNVIRRHLRAIVAGVDASKLADIVDRRIASNVHIGQYVSAEVRRQLSVELVGALLDYLAARLEQDEDDE